MVRAYHDNHLQTPRRGGVFLILLLHLSHLLCIRAGNINSMPVILQCKSLWQIINNDQAGSLQTQEEFVTLCVRVSQLNSTIESIKGDDEKAREIQEKFAKGLYDSLNRHPVLGVVKGIIHSCRKEHEEADRAYQSIGRTLVQIPVAMGASMIGGPGLGATASIFLGNGYDAMVAGIETKTKNKPFAEGSGLASMLTRHIGNKKYNAGEVFDETFGIAMEAIPSKTATKVGLNWTFR